MGYQPPSLVHMHKHYQKCFRTFLPKKFCLRNTWKTLQAPQHKHIIICWKHGVLCSWKLDFHDFYKCATQQLNMIYKWNINNDINISKKKKKTREFPLLQMCISSFVKVCCAQSTKLNKLISVDSPSWAEQNKQFYCRLYSCQDIFCTVDTQVLLEIKCLKAPSSTSEEELRALEAQAPKRLTQFWLLVHVNHEY